MCTIHYGECLFNASNFLAGGVCVIDFESTGGGDPKIDFFGALLRGLAPDGGLYVPTALPDLSAYRKSGESFWECARGLAQGYDERLAYSVSAYRRDIFPFSPLVRRLDKNNALLELFHGPTGAFKDFGASFLAYSMDAELKRRRGRATILTATSGDTGSAVAHAFYRKDAINVVVLFPAGRISRLQKQQITTYGENIHPLEVDGSFDDCQRLVKEAFRDSALRDQLALTSANSINIGRLIPQQFYYHYAHRVAQHAGRLFFVVPSGNLGNLTAAVLALKSEPQITGCVAATNANRVFVRYMRSGRYRPRASAHTYSNAMDVGRPSNLVRLQALCNNNLGDLHHAVPMAVSVSDRGTLKTMQEVNRRYGILVDPHTAVGLSAAQQFLRSPLARADDLVISLATAHPAKFREVALKALKVDPPLPDRFKAILQRESRCTPVSATYRSLRELLLHHFG